MLGKIGSCSGGQGLAQESFNLIVCCWAWGGGGGGSGSHSIPGSCLVWGDPTLGSTGLCGRVSGKLPEGLRYRGPSSAPVPAVSPCHPASPGGPPALAGGFGSVSCGRLLLFSRSWCVQNFVCAKTGVSVSLSLLWGLWSNPVGSQGQIPWGSPVPLLDPRLASLTRCSEPSQQWEICFGIISLQSGDHPPGKYGVWFHHDCAPPTISLQRLCLWMWVTAASLSLDVGCLFWWVPMVVLQLVKVLLLSQEMSACPSTLPSWTKSAF